MSFLIRAGRRFAEAGSCVLAVAAVFGCLAGFAQAATPAWKLLAVTGPSNLPPRQSEVQRLTVDAEGGTFELGRKEEVSTFKTVGEPLVPIARLSLTAGSATATIEAVDGNGRVEPGDRVSLPGNYEATTIVSCSEDCEATGSTIELSRSATATESGATRQIYTREVELTRGAQQPQVGDEIVEVTESNGQPGLNGGYLPPEATVTAVSPERFTVSDPPREYDPTYEGNLLTFTVRQVSPSELTGPIPYGAPAAEVRHELEALPAYGPDSVEVVGSGTVDDPYLIEFAGEDGQGPLALRDVPQLEVETGALTGATAGANVFTTVPGGPGTGEIDVFPTNLGGAPTKGLTTVTIGPLPAGITASGPGGGAAQGGAGIWSCTEAPGSATVVCDSEVPVASLRPLATLHLPIEVEPTVATDSSVPIEIDGGGSEPDSFQLPLVVSAEPAPFATRAYWAGAFDAEGDAETQAGGHPASAQTFFVLNTVRSQAGRIVPAGLLKEADVDLPPGLVGDPLVVPRCPQEQLAAAGEELTECNAAMEVGRFEPLGYSLEENDGIFYSPIYDDVPAAGSAAEFTTKILFPFQSLLGSVRSDGDFGVSVTAPNVANVIKLFGSYAALEGSPPGAQGKAFLTNPTDCAEQAQSPPVADLRLEAYELPGVPSSTPIPVPAVTGCDLLDFTPALSLAPSDTRGSSPAGAAVDLHLPQEALTRPDQLAQPDLRKAAVTLPEGLTADPSSADGLASCTEAQIGYVGPGPMPNPTRFDKAPVTCPDASKIGTVKIGTPLLEEELEGTIYLAAQEENPFDSLLAVYLVVESGRFGITLKLPGKVEPDPRTGRLTATFDDSPQLPFEDLALTLRGGGPRSVLATPEVCGHYRSTGSLEPWSAPESGPPAQIEEGGFDVSTNCSGSAAARPFAPAFEAGTVGTRAGSYSPLVIKVSRNDGEQELRSLDFTLPEGLTGRLAGIPYCPDASIRAAEGMSGKAEQAAPSCPAASRIGTVDTAAGVGGEPIHVGGEIYLAGPYEGAPLSAVVVTPALAGPFDLGDVVIRSPLLVDPETAQITAKSDPIPTVLRGIPLKVRSVVIDLDRPGFTLDPTSCDPMTATASIAGSSGATANPSDRFQVGGCGSLKFRPRLKLSLNGSTKHGGHPALRAVLTYPKMGAYSNIARAQVNLPHSEFIDQGNLDKTCTKPVLLEGNCTKRSIYGHAKAWTPLLEKPLEGPVYLVGGYGFKLPALVAELNGQIRVLLKGKVDSGPNRGIRNTFEAIPDAPVERFELRMKGGSRYSLLENSENLCDRSQHAIARFTAQNGKVEQMRPLIKTSCGMKTHKGSKRKGSKKHGA